MNDAPDDGCAAEQGLLRRPGRLMPDALRRLVAETWTLRRQEELDAGLRFARLAESLEQLRTPAPWWSSLAGQRRTNAATRACAS
ncbi:hypothetical protein ACLEPN_05615 [Myxococcus sp. 1LA]